MLNLFLTRLFRVSLRPFGHLLRWLSSLLKNERQKPHTHAHAHASQMSRWSQSQSHSRPIHLDWDVDPASSCLRYSLMVLSLQDSKFLLSFFWKSRIYVTVEQLVVFFCWLKPQIQTSLQALAHCDSRSRYCYSGNTNGSTSSFWRFLLKSCTRTGFHDEIWMHNQQCRLSQNLLRSTQTSREIRTQQATAAVACDSWYTYDHSSEVT
jgi:hypothetical protein